jgi:biopolymer transport protein ExbD
MAAILEGDPTNQKCEMNMTPMVDIVFQLILFFMLTVQLGALDMETMSLPYADQAEEQKEDPEKIGTVVVNINKDDAQKGIVRVQGREYDKNKLAELMRIEALRSGEERDPQFPKLKIYKLKVLIRCDRDARYETVQWVFDACSKNGVWKTIIAASPTTE